MSVSPGTKARATVRPRMDPRIGRRRAEVARARGRRRLRAIVASVGLVVVGVGVLVVLHSPVFSARHVSVLGARHTGRGAVLRAGGLVGAPPLVDVDPGAAAARIEALPWVRTASVGRRWPDGVEVRVTERVPVAVVAARGTMFLVDASGRLLQRAPAPPPGLPALSSTARPGRPGSSLGPSARPGLLVAAELGRLLPGRVRQVTVVPGGTVVLDLGHGVRAVFGPASALDAKLEALSSVLAGAPPRGPESIDVSVPGEPTVALGASSSA